MPATPAYDALTAHYTRLHRYQHLAAIVGWDRSAMMPPKGNEARSAAVSELNALIHRTRTDARLAGWIAAAADEPLDAVARANLREIERDWRRAVALPESLVAARTLAAARCEHAWRSQRAANDWRGFLANFREVVQLARAEAQHLADASGLARYDALLERYEPGMRSATLERLFAELREWLPGLIAQVVATQRDDEVLTPVGPFPVERQRALARALMTRLGFDFDAGRLDVSTHPFCSGLTPQDVRLTTRYDEHYLPMSLFGVMHEAGHGLYEQGLDPAHAFTPLGQSVSLGIHESQSRMWENLVGRSRSFWLYFYPLLQAALPAWREVPLDDWYFAINTVKPSLIRVEADEVTYNLHIMLRFDLERRMLRGEIAVRDVPAAWNDAFKSLLGITPSSDAEGCLQDIHWSMGIFGYFPTYALGNLYACQFFKAANQALPDLPARIAHGELQPLRDWLRKNIHVHGQRYRADELVKRVTGRPLGHADFMEHLRSKYQPLYGLH